MPLKSRNTESPELRNFRAFFDQSVTHAHLGPTKARSSGLPRCILFTLADGSPFGAHKQWLGRTARFYPLVGDVFGHAGAVNIQGRNLGRKMPRVGSEMHPKMW